jgi:hypothetical protein
MGPICLGLLSYFIDCLLLFSLWFVSICAFLCLILLMDGFLSLILYIHGFLICNMFDVQKTFDKFFCHSFVFKKKIIMFFIVTSFVYFTTHHG